MRNLTYDYISGYFFRRIEGNIHSSNPESMAPSISPYITASGKLMAKMVVGADPCVCPETSIIILFLRGRETSQGLCPQVSGFTTPLC